MNPPDMLAEIILAQKPLLRRFLQGFNDNNHTATAPNLPNHAAWTLGHLALYMHRSAEHFDKSPLPESDFITGDGSQGDATRFDTESICFASNPAHATFPPMARCIEIFEASCDRLASALRAAPEAQLQSDLKWGTQSFPTWMIAPRMANHAGTHTGQLLDLRRALNMPRILG